MIWILDNGHGGIEDGQYMTQGKQWMHPDGRIIYEGDFNRKIVQLIARRLDELRIPRIILVPEARDVSLQERVSRANSIHDSFDGRCILVSVHANAGRGTGWEVWTSVGQTESDNVATYFHDEIRQRFPGKRMRSDFSDGDVDKESQFYILRYTKSPAILTENFFMDHLEDFELLMSTEGRVKIAASHVDAIRRYETENKTI